MPSPPPPPVPPDRARYPHDDLAGKLQLDRWFAVTPRTCCALNHLQERRSTAAQTRQPQRAPPDASDKSAPEKHRHGERPRRRRLHARSFRDDRPLLIVAPAPATLNAGNTSTLAIARQTLSFAPVLRRLATSPQGGLHRTGTHRLGNHGQLQIGRKPSPASDAGDHFDLRERVGHRRLPRLIPRPSGYCRCPVETGAVQDRARYPHHDLPANSTSITGSPQKPPTVHAVRRGIVGRGDQQRGKPRNRSPHLLAPAIDLARRNVGSTNDLGNHSARRRALGDDRALLLLAPTPPLNVGDNLNSCHHIVASISATLSFAPVLSLPAIAPQGDLRQGGYG